MTSLTPRYLTDFIEEDLTKKMVFLAGPRQVGKTTLAFSLLNHGDPEHPAYFNWDTPGRNHDLLKGLLPNNQPLVVIDEIHKYRKWRNLVKGYYDHYKGRIKFLVTGSARLDYFSRGGDSLQGRYHLYRLHPLSLKEVSPAALEQATLMRLLTYGGFPEPFFEADQKHWRRWQQERLRRVINEDLVSLEQVKDLSAISLLAEILPTKVGSPLSVQNLRTDLEIAHATAERWLQILENLYYCFRILPFGGPKIKAVKKEPKLYLWDWSLCSDEATRFENLVACQLLKYCHLMEDSDGFHMELRYIRDVEKREIDFVVLKQKKPLFAVECKLGSRDISKNVPYFSKRLHIPYFYQVHLEGSGLDVAGLNASILSFRDLVKKLDLP